jgi:hypothetical protein
MMLTLQTRGIMKSISTKTPSAIVANTQTLEEALRELPSIAAGFCELLRIVVGLEDDEGETQWHSAGRVRNADADDPALWCCTVRIDGEVQASVPCPRGREGVMYKYSEKVQILGNFQVLSVEPGFSVTVLD